MRNYSYKRLANIMSAYFGANRSVKRFYATIDEQIPNLATESEQFPVVFMVPVSATLGDHITQTVKFIVYDRLEKDRSNELDIISDTELILNDIRQWLGPDNEEFYTVIAITDPVASPLNNKLLDYCSGWEMTVSVDMTGTTICDIPLEGIPYPPNPSLCPSVNIEVNGNSFATVPSGGTLPITVEYETSLANPIQSISGNNIIIIDPVVIPPLKVYYNRVVYNNIASYTTGDERYWRDNGVNNYISSLPEDAVIQRLDPFSEDKLHYFNKWGHKWRFTGTTGGYWDNVTNEWKDKFGAVTTEILAFPEFSPGLALISDLLSGLQWLNDVTAVNYNWVNFCASSLTNTDGGYTDWIAPNQGTNRQLIGGQETYNSGVWSTTRKPFVGWDRAAIWSSSTYLVSAGNQAIRNFLYGDSNAALKTNNGNVAYCRQENNDYVIQP